MKRQVDPDVRLLQAAADPTRLSILRQLTAGDPVCACDFEACGEVAQPTVSHHLKVLREAGWVTAMRRGSWVYYSLNHEAVVRFRVLSRGLSPQARPAGGLRPAGSTGGADRLRLVAGQGRR